MTTQLDGTVALVTGASSGIGEASARELARRGATVALAARRKDRLDKVAKDIQADGGRALVIELDVTVQQQVIDAVEHTVAELGRLDTVVSNAGVMLIGPVQGAPTEEWERMLSVNLKGTLYLAHAALPHLLAAAQSSSRQVADMVVIGSVAGRVETPNWAVYTMTKHGLRAFTEAFRKEVGDRRVRVSTIEPGAVATELGMHFRPEIAAHVGPQFFGREVLEAEDVADAVAYVVTRRGRVGIHDLFLGPTTFDCTTLEVVPPVDVAALA